MSNGRALLNQQLKINGFRFLILLTKDLAMALMKIGMFRKVAESGIDFLVASSFSKNLALYNERVGALTVVSPSKKEASVAMSHVKKLLG